jgi:predicted DNA-binding transcriptional regulator YafY
VLVEPIVITDFKYLTAFDVVGEKTKIYSIDRITTIEVTGNGNQFLASHQHLQPDAFGMATGEAFDVELALSTRAYLLMKEEYPRTTAYIQQQVDENYPWQFKSTVYGLQGIGRFVMGLIAEVRIIQGEALELYIKEKLKNAVLLN